MAAWIKMALGMEVGLPRRLCVRWGANPLPKKGAEPPQFSAHVYCGQTARCIKMPLCMEVGSAQATLCQMGRSSPKRGTAPVFGSCLFWRNGWMDEKATWYGSTPWPRPHCIRWGPSSQTKGHSSPHPLFGPCLLWPRSPISAAAEFLLLLCNKHWTTTVWSLREWAYNACSCMVKFETDYYYRSLSGAGAAVGLQCVSVYVTVFIQ